MKIVGYSDRFSVRPRQRIRFMVSSKLPTYEAEIVRLIHGDPNPMGSGVEYEPVETPVSGRYEGRTQELHRGSFVVVPEAAALDYSEGFTLQAWILPMTPHKRVQGILTQWSESAQVGYGLFVNPEQGLELWMGSGPGRVDRIRAGQAMRASQWYFVAGSYNARTGKARLYQEPQAPWPLDTSGAVIEAALEQHDVVASQLPLLMAGYCKETEAAPGHVDGHFNGKIDRPCLFGRALGPSEVELLRDGTAAGDLGQGLLAAWDLSLDLSGEKVSDVSPNGMHGRTVNMPLRAVTGHNWTGDEVDFRAAPAEYGAIHFHDDDLEDAAWEVDFELSVPPDLASGVYAARLSSSDAEDYVPFFVRPPKGTASSDIAVLMPTLTYLAYANQQFNNPDRLENRGLEPGSSRPEDQFIVSQQLHSLYDLHSDGSCVSYSFRLRPILNLRPGYRMPPLSAAAGSPHHLSLDLHLVGWLEAKSYRYDVITDEDLHQEGLGLLSPYRVVLTGSHPEYWTGRMIEGLEGYLVEGGRFMYLGGNGFYWVTSVDPERPHAIEVRRWGGMRSCESEPGQYHHSTTGEMGGLWRFRNRQAQKLVGVGFTSLGTGPGRPYRRQPGSFDPRAAFIFEGIGSDELIGDFASLVQEQGAAGFEIDRFDLALGTPAHTLLLASSFGHSDGFQCALEDLFSLSGPMFGSESPRIRADMVYFETPRGGAVFSVGSIAWCGGLPYNGYENNVSRVTENVLSRFASDRPLP